MATFSSNGLQELWKKLKSSVEDLFTKKSTSVVGIDIGSSSIKVVQLRQQGGRAVLETYGELALGPYRDIAIGQAVQLPEEKISEALLDILKEANVTATQAGMAIPLQSSLISLVEMPVVPERQLKETVPIEARRYIPVPISEVALDWNVIPESIGEIAEGPGTDDKEEEEEGTPREKMLVLVAAIHNEMIRRYERLAEKAGLSLQFLEIEVFSFIRSLLKRHHGTSVVVDIGAGTTKLSIVENGITISTHSINRGSQEITKAIARASGMSTLKAEEYKREHGVMSRDDDESAKSKTARLIMGRIFLDVQGAILRFERKYHKTIDTVILTGGGSLLKGIMSVAEENLDVTVERANPFANLEAPAFLDDALAEIGPNFAVAIGVALRSLEEL